MTTRRPALISCLFLALAACGSDGGSPTPTPDVDATTSDAPSDDADDAAEPDVAEPDVAESDATETDAAEPDAEPDAAEPDVAQPDVAQPDITEPDATEPDATEPDATEPEPDVAEPEPDIAEPEPDVATEPDVTPDVDLNPCPSGACVPGTLTCPSLASTSTCVEGAMGCGSWAVSSPCPPNHVCHHGECAACVDAYTDDAGLPEEWAINGLTCVGVAFGTAPATFSPSSPITRGEALGWLVHGMQWAVECPFTPTFTDLAGSNWACEVETAAAHGLLTPDAAGKAHPDQPLTRADLAVYALRAVELPPEPLGDNPFTDTVGHPAEPWITLAFDLGLVFPQSGDDLYGPDDPATRAAAAFAVWEVAR